MTLEDVVWVTSGYSLCLAPEILSRSEIRIKAHLSSGKCWMLLIRSRATIYHTPGIVLRSA